ncbi:MAG: hypothetical protein R3B99_23500 [Polyangiales bacterium]
MSMWLELVKVEESVAQALRKDPSVGEVLFFGKGETPPSLDPERDAVGLDYRTYSALVDGLEEAGEDCTWTHRVLGDDYGEAVEFELTYGNAWVFTPDEVRAIAAGLASEAWDPEEDYEENLARFFARAAEEGKAVVGGVN